MLWKDDAVATSWCAECKDYLCDNCVQAHKRVKLTKAHVWKTIIEFSSKTRSNLNLLVEEQFEALKNAMNVGCLLLHVTYNLDYLTEN